MKLPAALFERVEEMRWQERHETRTALIEAALEEYLAAREGAPAPGHTTPAAEVL